MDQETHSATDATVVTEAFATARELLQRAEEDAALIRADADRYRRQREQEAELLVGKARRLLLLAESKAAQITAAAPAPLVVDVDAAAAEPGRADPVRAQGRRSRSQLDSILATAVSNAVHRALPADR